MAVSLGELAVRFGCELRGDPQLRVGRVATLAQADSGALSFLANPQYRRQLLATRATAVVLDGKSAADCPVAALVHANPYAIYARIAALLQPAVESKAGVHPAAVVAGDAQVHASAAVAAGAVVGARARIGARCRIGAGCIVGDDVVIGADSELRARVVLERGVVVGERVLLHPGVVIGADGFGFAREGERWIKVPQLGAVRLGDDVEIGANTTIDRGALEDTVIQDGVKIDNQVQIAHNVLVGAHTVIAACTGISGSTRIGKRCIIAGAAGIGGHLDICDDVVFTGMAAVTHSVTEPGTYSSAIPIEPARIWRRLVGRFKRLDSYAQRLRRIEQRVGMESESKTEQDQADD